MRLPTECYQMQQVIETYLPHLSQPQLTGLARWVCGTILAGSACQNAVASALSPGGNWNSLRQYLREWLYDGSDRARPCRTELDVALCFAPLLRWVLIWWRSDRLALAVDPTLKGDDTTAIVISVVYRGCAIPVVWRILRANRRGAWMDPNRGTVADPGSGRSQGYDRGGAVRPRPDQSQIVATDTRSEPAPAKAGGWHPYMRYRKNVRFCAQDGRRLPAQRFVSRPDPARVSRHWLVLSVATLLTLAYGTRVEDANDRRVAPANLRTPPKALAPRARQPLASAETDRQCNPPRHRLDEAVAAQRPALAPGVAAAGTQAQPGDCSP